jgi:hypothetical protein
MVIAETITFTVTVAIVEDIEVNPERVARALDSAAEEFLTSEGLQEDDFAVECKWT